MSDWKVDEELDGNDKSGITENSSDGDVLEVAFEFDSDEILLSYPI